MYKTPKLKSNFIPADWNEGNTPENLSVIQIKNHDLYIRDIEDISSRLLNKYNAENFKIKVFPGSDIAIFSLFSLLSTEHDKIYLLNEDYKQVAFFARVLFREVFYINDLEDDLQQLPEGSVLYFSNPGNPSCKYYDSQELSKKLPKNIVSIVDLAYVDYHENFDYNDFQSHNNIFFVKTCSKFYGLAAIRIGMLIFNTSNANLEYAFEAVNSKWIGEIQYNALALVLGFNDVLLRKNLKIKFLALESYLSKHFGSDCKIYHAGNYFRLDFLGVSKKQEFLDFMESRNISVRDLGHIESLKNSIRISYRDELPHALYF
jgi:histidinol-phosphate aminotransferase